MYRIFAETGCRVRNCYIAVTKQRDAFYPLFNDCSILHVNLRALETHPNGLSLEFSQHVFYPSHRKKKKRKKKWDQKIKLVYGVQPQNRVLLNRKKLTLQKPKKIWDQRNPVGKSVLPLNRVPKMQHSTVHPFFSESKKERKRVTKFKKEGKKNRN